MSLRLLALSAALISSLPSPAQTAAAVAGRYAGEATVRGQQAPVHLQITGSGSALKAALLNGPELAPASSVTITGDHLLVSFNYFARTLDATVQDGKLSGTFGTATVKYPVTLNRESAHLQPAAGVPAAPAIGGDWEIEVKSSKGESAWQLRVDDQTSPGQVRAVIQRIDGDTGSLFGRWTGTEFRVSHLSAAGPALYSLKPEADGTLRVSNLLASEAQRAQQVDLIARRPAAARAANLSTTTQSTEQTTVKDPSQPLTFAAPDLSGKLVTNADPRFDGKVVIVAIGGSWCPNCHDEAPFLESLYKQFHSRGLEVVDLSFEEADQMKDPVRLRAFIKRYGITYPVLLAGEPEQLTEKITNAEHLNCWPTSFFIGRDGKVREVHAGYAGPANPAANKALIAEVTSLVDRLLAEPATAKTAQR